MRIMKWERRECSRMPTIIRMATMIEKKHYSLETRRYRIPFFCGLGLSVVYILFISIIILDDIGLIIDQEDWIMLFYTPLDILLFVSCLIFAYGYFYLDFYIKCSYYKWIVLFLALLRSLVLSISQLIFGPIWMNLYAYLSSLIYLFFFLSIWIPYYYIYGPLTAYLYIQNPPKYYCLAIID